MILTGLAIRAMTAVYFRRQREAAVLFSEDAGDPLTPAPGPEASPFFGQLDRTGFRLVGWKGSLWHSSRE